MPWACMFFLAGVFLSSLVNCVCSRSLSTPTSASGTSPLGSATWRTKRRERNTCTRWVSRDKKPNCDIYQNTPFTAPFIRPTSLSSPSSLTLHMPSSLGTTRTSTYTRDGKKKKLWHPREVNCDSLKIGCHRERLSQTEAIQLAQVAAIQAVPQQQGPTNWLLAQTDGVRAGHTKSTPLAPLL